MSRGVTPLSSTCLHDVCEGTFMAVLLEIKYFGLPYCVVGQEEVCLHMLGGEDLYLHLLGQKKLLSPPTWRRILVSSLTGR